MEHAVHHDLLGFDLVENGVWKSPNERSTHGWIDQRERLGMALDGCERRIDGGEEVGRAVGRLPVVPEVSLVEMKLGQA